MRIIAGEFRGRKLAAPKGLDVRPTADRVKEALFSMLGTGVRGARVLDLFAGAGNLGLEAISRGAERVVFVEQSPRSIAAIRANIEALGVGDRTLVLRQDLSRGLGPAVGHGPFDIVFLDPPYGRNLAGPTLAGLTAEGLLGPGALIILEHGRKEDPNPPPGLETAETRGYGQTALTFLTATDG